jgi:hypothetical protein
MRPNEIKKLITDLKVKPSDALDAKVYNAIDDAQEEKTKTQSAYKPNIWRILMKSPITKLAAAAVIIAAAIIGFHFIGGGSITKPCLAWDCVVSHIMDANTAEFDIIIGEEGKAPLIHDMIKGSRIHRTLEGMQETSVIDLTSSKILSLDPAKKKAIYIELKDLPQIPNYMDQLRNVIKMLEAVPGFTIEDLGEKVIDGQMLYGYKAKHPKLEVEVWADPATGLPVRMEQQEGQMKIICKNMRFDVPMDDSLFDMNAPEGYKVEKQELNLFGSTEADFIEGLKIQAEVLDDGVFPDDVSVEYIVKIAPTVKEKFDKMTCTDDEKTKLGMNLQKGVMFIRYYKGEGKWIYAGKDVKLGDANTAIFWYRPAGSQTYHVIYGDLTVKEANEPDLPRPIDKK